MIDRRTAYHEVGHAVAALAMCCPVYRIHVRGYRDAETVYEPANDPMAELTIVAGAAVAVRKYIGRTWCEIAKSDLASAQSEIARISGLTCSSAEEVFGSRDWRTAVAVAQRIVDTEGAFIAWATRELEARPGHKLYELTISSAWERLSTGTDYIFVSRWIHA